ncbi:MAG TPA: TonB-dependent receptor [Vicinamibacterales bacterium]|nr:TonB-dependent receptor [Vicinamibacterales bacterium]
MKTVIALLLLAATPAYAQVFTGRIDVTIEDSTGGRLPGVSVDVTGPVNASLVTDAQGEAHFLNLPVGTYSVKGSIQGFNPYANSQVVVATGAATPLLVRLAVAGTSETVTVTAATPTIDVKRSTTTTNVTLEELQNIPTARDPWVVMQTVPTIYVDRVNVGGSESGQQSNYIGKGSVGTDNTWNIDGVPITDMGSTGSTPTYYDFDMFQEMSITTGGASAQNPTPGVQLNLVLKKGSNTPHGNARYYFENEKLQGNNMDPTLAKTIGGTNPACIASNFTEHCGNRTDSYKDYGFDLGGPILKDKLWAWGAIGKTNPRILTLTGTSDETILKNYAFKADGQLNANVRGNFTFFEGNKEKFGRGASAVHPAETTWDQTGPTKLFKGEGNFVAGQNLFVAARYAYITNGFTLTPEGGTNTSFYKDDAGVWHNSYYFYTTNRPQYYGGADASYFAGKHEVKFGFSYRRTPVDSLTQVTGNKTITYWAGYPNLGGAVQYDYVSSTVGKYIQGYVTDTISMNRLTLTGGIRFDHQTSSIQSFNTPAVPGFEKFLPSVDTPAQDNAYDFNNVTPRLGLTYAIDENRKTIARASYAMFASQLPGNAAGFVSPIQNYTYVYYSGVDRQTNGQPCVTVGVNGCNGILDKNELNINSPDFGNNVNLAKPGVFTSVNKVSNVTAPRTQELMFGVDHELMPNFGVSATMTYRYINNLLWNPPNGLTGYAQSGTFTGTFANVGTVSVPFYKSLGTTSGGGFDAQNRPDYHQRYLGFEVSATKRMSDHWMARLGFASTSWNEYFDASDAIADPTRAPYASTEFQNLTLPGPLQNGGPVVVRSTGSGKSSIYLLPPKYQMTANGLYQGPWGIDFGGNLVVRQGYGEPFYRDRVATGDPVTNLKTVLLTSTVDQFRLDPVASFDIRLEKMFKFGTTSAAFDFDVFNVFNAATVLGYQYNARVSSYNTVQEIMNPRIGRIGVRFMF